MTDQEAFDCLSSPVQHYIRQKGWTAFRPIQRAAISRILKTDKHYILASRTASGKTEAAFLPILSSVDFNQPGVQVLYISPLIALINDQLDRVIDLCKYMDVLVTKWHGETKQSEKNRVLKDPSGILLITPESIEAMFDNHPGNAAALFSNLKFIIVDEIHYFVGSDRGIQLQSLISRIGRLNSKQPRIIGLSATIGDFDLAKEFTGDADNTIVLLDSERKEIDVSFRYYEEEDVNFLPIDLIKDVFRTTYNRKSLVFPNKRSTVEELAVKLKHLAQLTGAPDHYFSHHSSVDREVREYVEFFAKHSNNTPFTICCTSTLELGIDIGSVELIAQVNATNSISSLIQRAGRSGRKDGTKAELIVYSTNPRKLLQALACWNLHEQGIIESPDNISQPYDILLHQILSIIKERFEITPDELIQTLVSIPAFKHCSKEDCVKIIKSLIQGELSILEFIGDKIIIGIDGERIVNNREFYSVFQSEKNFQVYHHKEKIGELYIGDRNIEAGKNVYLAARVWTILDVDFSRLKIFVEPATDGRPPIYESSTAQISKIIEQEMLRILYSGEDFSYLDDLSKNVLSSLRKEYQYIPCHDIPISFSDSGEGKENKTTMFLFYGTKVNDSIGFLIDCLDIDYNYDRKNGVIEFPATKEQFLRILDRCVSLSDESIIEKITDTLLTGTNPINSISKYGYLLPTDLQSKLILQKMYDIKVARQCLLNIINKLTVENEQ